MQGAATLDKQEKADLDTKIQAIRSTNTTMVAEYEKLISTEKGRVLYDAYRSARAGFIGSLDELLRTSRIGTAESDRRALDMLRTQLRPLQRKYAESTSNIVTYSKSLADDAGASIQASVSTTRTGISRHRCGS